MFLKFSSTIVTYNNLYYYRSVNYFYNSYISDRIKVRLGDMPNEMIQLFIGNDDTAKKFRDYIWQYNNALSFMLFGATPPPGYGSYYFNIRGLVHRRVSPLYPENKKDRAYGQLWYVGLNAANDIRSTRAANCGKKKEILTKLNKNTEEI